MTSLEAARFVKENGNDVAGFYDAAQVLANFYMEQEYGHVSSIKPCEAGCGNETVHKSGYCSIACLINSGPGSDNE